MIADARVFPPISGEKSALLGTPGDPGVPFPHSQRFTVRLAVSAGDTVVRFSLGQFVSSGVLLGGGFNAQVRLAVPGGTIAAVPLTDLGSAGTDQLLPGGTHVTVVEVTMIEAPLPSGVGDEVVFDFQNGIYSASCSLPVPVSGYQIDDLRVE
jgi:hypothetical protein